MWSFSFISAELYPCSGANESARQGTKVLGLAVLLGQRAAGNRAGDCIIREYREVLSEGLMDFQTARRSVHSGNSRFRNSRLKTFYSLTIGKPDETQPRHPPSIDSTFV